MSFLPGSHPQYLNPGLDVPSTVYKCLLICSPLPSRAPVGQNPFLSLKHPKRLKHCLAQDRHSDICWIDVWMPTIGPALWSHFWLKAVAKPTPGTSRFPSSKGNTYLEWLPPRHPGSPPGSRRPQSRGCRHSLPRGR